MDSAGGDNRAPDANKAVSKTIRFDREGITTTTETNRDKKSEEAAARIEKLITMQKENLTRTTALQIDATSDTARKSRSESNGSRR